MAIDQTYRLIGYIEYDQSSVGFVTPIFKNQRNDYCIQVAGSGQHPITWELLPSQLKRSVLLPTTIQQVKTFDLPVYGFKWDTKLFFAPSNDMAQYLSNALPRMSTDGADLATAFLNDLKFLQPTTIAWSRDEVWRKCKVYLSTHGLFDQIFLQYVEVVNFEEGTLSIHIKNRAIKNIFKSRGIIRSLEQHMRKEILNFKVDLINDDELMLPILFTFDSKSNVDVQLSGSFIIKTSINKFQSFDNFIVGDFNKSAFARALEFTTNETDTFLLISGYNGLGKTHLVNSIAKSFTENDNDKDIGLYSVLALGGKDYRRKLNIEGFEQTAAFHDVIIIDDVHRIDVDSTKQLMPILKKWSNEGKKIVISIDKSAYEGTLEREWGETDCLFLYAPKAEDKRNVIKWKTHELNLPLTGSDILNLSENGAIKNISDIHRSLTRIFLREELRTKRLWTYYGPNKLRIDSIEPLVCDYLRIDTAYYVKYPTDPTVENAKILSRFIQSLVEVYRREDSVSGSDIINTGSHLYSWKAMEHYLFKSDHFRKIVLEILLELISNRAK